MPKIPKLKPLWTTSDNRTVRLYRGDVNKVLRRLPVESVQMVVTSPPYWGLRDYGIAEWEGGDDGCNHVEKTIRNDSGRTTGQGGPIAGGVAYYKSICRKCGAKRTSEEIGSEGTPEAYVAKMVEVFRAVRRVLRDDGTVWLNLGDSYASGGDHQTGRNDTKRETPGGRGGSFRGGPRSKTGQRDGLKPKDLIGIPWRVAFALQADGWWLRSDIIWAKPNPMPESIKNRCTKSHEYLFLLAKSQKYFYDNEAIKEPSKTEWNSAKPSFGFVEPRRKLNFTSAKQRDMQRTQFAHNTYHPDVVQNMSNKRSVWSIATEAFEGAHFATFPRKLVEPCVLAGTSEKGACAKCGAPWGRVVSRKRVATRPGRDTKIEGHSREEIGNRDRGRHVTSTKTMGWEPTCDCNGRFRMRKRAEYDEKGKRRIVRWKEYVPSILLEDHPIEPCVVLDPFVGSGTTAVVCIDKGRRCWGIDLSEEYLQNQAVVRIEGALLSRPELAYLAGRTTKRIELGRRVGKSK